MIDLSRVESQKETLPEMLLKGCVFLKADVPKRCNFAFSIREDPIGVYAAVSNAPGSLQLVRAWNAAQFTFDIFNRMLIPTPGRQFNRLLPGEPMFLFELDGALGVVDKVAFRPGRVSRSDVVPFKVDAEVGLNFEVATLSQIEVLG